MKKTKARCRVFAALSAADTPLCAAQLYERVLLSGESVPLATLYRTLDLFVKNSIALKLPMPDAGISLYELNRHEHKHYAFCIGCRKTLDLETCPVMEAERAMRDAGFHVLGHRLELYGYCKSCYGKTAPRKKPRPV